MTYVSSHTANRVGGFSSHVTLLWPPAVIQLPFPNFNTFVFCDSETCFKYQLLGHLVDVYVGVVLVFTEDQLY